MALARRTLAPYGSRGKLLWAPALPPAPRHPTSSIRPRPSPTRKPQPQGSIRRGGRGGVWDRKVCVVKKVKCGGNHVLPLCRTLGIERCRKLWHSKIKNVFQRCAFPLQSQNNFFEFCAVLIKTNQPNQPKMTQQDFPYFKISFFPLWPLWSGRGEGSGGGVTPPPRPVVYGILILPCPTPPWLRRDTLESQITGHDLEPHQNATAPIFPLRSPIENVAEAGTPRAPGTIEHHRLRWPWSERTKEQTFNKGPVGIGMCWRCGVGQAGISAGLGGPGRRVRGGGTIMRGMAALGVCGVMDLCAAAGLRAGPGTSPACETRGMACSVLGLDLGPWGRAKRLVATEANSTERHMVRGMIRCGTQFPRPDIGQKMECMSVAAASAFGVGLTVQHVPDQARG